VVRGEFLWTTATVRCGVRLWTCCGAVVVTRGSEVFVVAG
jgi:hypothetical protein